MNDSDILLQPDTFRMQVGTAPDEAFAADGSIRPHWRYLLDGLTTLGKHALQERQEKAHRILRDDGATYQRYNTPDTDPTWQLNPVPLLIDSEQWSETETALIERAELFNFILDDIYGKRELIHQGIIPPELLFSHPGFLRPCDQVKLRGMHQLIIHSCDLVRDHDGKMTVLSDRTQAPSGAGYALENRIVMSRVFPSLFRDSHVHRISLFFTRLRQKLLDLNPNDGPARIVVLTPGAYNETYFEHAFIANHLGFNLVQGNDLVVKQGYVWLKSLEGLKRVDVILRRVDDHYCDPVELNGSSRLGTPGLLDVARQGRVAIVNPLGANVLENPAWMRYLPAISRHFLGRELRMGSVRTWWGGNADDLAYMCDNLETLFIKPTYRRPGLYEVYGAELDTTRLQAWKNRILKNPAGFVAQQYLACTHTPTWLEGRIQPRATVLRTFAIASENSYEVMAGGLTRVNLDAKDPVVSNQRGAVSKDTWILASEPEKTSARASQTQQLPIEHRHEIPSRVLENLFWLGRYTERAESGLRLLRALFLQLNRTETLPDDVYRTLMSAMTEVTCTWPGFTDHSIQGRQQAEQEIVSLLNDQQRIGSIAFNLHAMTDAAEQAREQFSSDAIRVINAVHDELGNLNRNLLPGTFSAPDTALGPLISSLLALSGWMHDNMIRGYDWYFIQTGRCIERSLQLISVLRSLLVKVPDATYEDVLLEPALQWAESHALYRRMAQEGMRTDCCLELLLLNGDNPRSLMYQLTQLSLYFAQFPTSPNRARERKLLLEASTSLQLVDIARLAATDESNLAERSELDALLKRLQGLVTAIAEEIARQYFDHSASPQMLVDQSEWQELL